MVGAESISSKYLSLAVKFVTMPDPNSKTQQECYVHMYAILKDDKDWGTAMSAPPLFKGVA